MRIDYSGPYPQMFSNLPNQVWLRYHQLALKKGYLRRAGSVTLPSENKKIEGKTSKIWCEEAKIPQSNDLNNAEKILIKNGFDPKTGARADWDAGPSIARFKTGPRPSRFDPRSISDLTQRIIETQGWGKNLSIEILKERWPELVGEKIAENSSVQELKDQKLIITANSTAWAQQLKWLLPQLEKKVSEFLDEDTVKQIIIHGPQAPNWKKGLWSVKGRGPRDTYG